MTRSGTTVVVTLALLIAACGGSTSTDTGLVGESDSTALSTSESRNSQRVYGTVRGTSVNGTAPLAGATVTDGTRKVTTDAKGAYSLPENSGKYAITASATGFVTITQNVTVPRHGSVQLNFSLQTDTTTPPPPPPSGWTPPPLPPTPPPPPAAMTGTSYRVFANNDLGMHCVDSSFAVFSILPPYNVVDAQVVMLQSTGKPVVLDATQVDVRFTGASDANGSINQTSFLASSAIHMKSNFWEYAGPLYGATTLGYGEGLVGMWMPADAPDASGRTLIWDTTMGLFRAPGIPIFPIDDAGKVNAYPLLRFWAHDKSGSPLGSTDVVLPVSDETSCSSCHATSTSDTEDQVRQRVLDLHNAKLGTALQAPVLCASCHYSPALDLAGTGPSAVQQQHKTMSRVMHDFHATKVVPAGYTDAAVGSGTGYLSAPPLATQQACYTCHPGVKTECLRGAMTSAIDCQNCHGKMAAVGGAVSNRTPWLDEPKCQSCHAGDAVSKTNSDQPYAADGLRFTLAYSPTDATATPKLATNKRFAENDALDANGNVIGAKLYRKSKGHGGLACEACHGSTHAIWSAGPNDNVAATQLQGHAGTIGECSTCHQAPPTNGLGGPHGMHPVGSGWVSAHQNIAEGHQSSCQPCHGTDYRGTVLSKMFATRSLAGKTFAAGTQIGCYSCHSGPNPG